MGNSIEANALGSFQDQNFPEKYEKTMGLLGKIFKRDNNKDLAEMMEGFEENKEEIV